MSFSVTAVTNVNVFPAQFAEALTVSRQDLVGRSRMCLYEYRGAPSRLTLHLGCTQRPPEGFYGYGENADEFPGSMAQDHAKLSRGHTCQASSTPATWPIDQDGYRIELALAAEMAQVTKDQYPGIVRALASKVNLPESDLTLVQVVPGSVVLRAFYPSNHNPDIDAQLGAAALRMSTKAGQMLAERPVIALSSQFRPRATVVISDADDDGRLHPVALPLMIVVCLFGVGLFGLALYLMIMDEKGLVSKDR
eukprot:TRINITY_DN10328_c0_g1_i1.p1 TRINITY_DN10328_c0_g1~~TRINITY_DN10328_c0_g1_i1.p1  ORF type:complete len:251 (-),score=53.72 TRINITY_DN10328_c0_g1_i1:244-996(-)